MTPAAQSPSMAVIIPALNEEEAIAVVVNEILAYAPLAQIIVVDNGSTDLTAQKAHQAGATVISQPVRGYGHACLAGAHYAVAAELLVFIDGDHSDHPEEIPLLLEPILSGKADLVIGSRVRGHRLPGSIHFHQLFGNRLFSWILNRLFPISITDIGPFRAISREHLLNLNLKELTYGWTLEMIIRAAQEGLRIVEAPVSYRPRLGQSKVSGTFSGSIKAAYGMFATLRGCYR